MNWFKTGTDAATAAKTEMERQAQARKEAKEKFNKLRRFYVKPGTTTTITFLDGPVYPDGSEFPFIFKEHQLNLNGSWQNWFTCLGGDCPICESGSKSSTVSAYTIIDHSQWSDKRTGEVHKDELKLFVCKMGTHEKLVRKMAKQGGTLHGKTFEVSRGMGDQSAAVGDDFDFEADLDVNRLFPEAVVNDYKEIFAPKDPTFLRRVLGEEVEANDKKIMW
jgi:hypothetical protein